jgi:hypothetical protein
MPFLYLSAFVILHLILIRSGTSHRNRRQSWHIQRSRTVWTTTPQFKTLRQSRNSREAGTIERLP